VRLIYLSKIADLPIALIVPRERPYQASAILARDMRLEPSQTAAGAA